ncbi:MAG: Sapep family Mn(2+)-dependent dipeptidase [Clostridia bacterium]|nr:Sapep family Mn(2+)-dependent dipeptidase [Clostridia bacterium]
MCNQKIYDLIDSYRDQYVSMLRRWVQVPSVKGEAEDGAPFGRDVRRMLDMAMVDAETLGFMTGAYDGYACDIRLGDSDDEIAVLGHLDVVPAGDGWNRPPFGAEMDNGRVYGRGTGDDKGPSLCALFAMKAIRDAGIPLRRSVRLILGCDEESGWEDMDWYTAHTDMPAMGFSPDASFPVINTEKSMLGFELRADTDDTGLKILRLETGERTNVIPGECEALLAGGDDLIAKVAAYAVKTGLPYTAEKTDGGILVHAAGIPGHSAYPQSARNAIGMMLNLLKELGVTGPVRTLADAVGIEYNGASLGCACSDDVSGALTCNIGILRIKDGHLFATLDYRCPITSDLDALQKATADHLPGIRVTCTKVTPPHHVPADSELVTALLSAYHEETGLDAYPMSTGGGTYAKVLKQGVAFGAGFPDDVDLAHQANEYVEIDKMILTIKIYANALIRLIAE